ncbi:hypothetical protein B0H14DRAFT_2556029 [Mycena olivaceomarginata]|nr:hypothetical protein B0H14DRAFT_2556029 [Mycena olivaceomarginata]
MNPCNGDIMEKIEDGGAQVAGELQQEDGGGTGGWGTATGGWGGGWGTAHLARRWFPLFSTVIAVWELCSANPGPRDGGNIGAGVSHGYGALSDNGAAMKHSFDRSYTNISSITSLSFSNWDSWDRVPAQKLLAAEKNHDLRMSDTLCHRRDTCHFGTNHPPDALFI